MRSIELYGREVMPRVRELLADALGRAGSAGSRRLRRMLRQAEQSHPERREGGIRPTMPPSLRSG